ncbi:MAG: CDP-alcohol phosphatidyltransferase family protein, partial [Acidobacteriaceae bacterium]
MRFPFRKEHLPWGMAGARAALGPILIAGLSCNWSGLALASLVLTALLSDIFDGVLARRWQCDTAGVRLFDSMADTFFYLCVAIALWIGQPQIWHSNSSLICAVLAAEAIRFVFDFAKFGTPASYHSWLAKTWGLLMAIAVIAAFASHHGALLIRASMIAGIVCNAETLTMSILLPVWRRDVPNLSQAWKIRREMLPLQPATMPPRLLSKSTRTSPRRQRQPSPSPLLSPAGVRQRPTPLRVNAPLELHRRLSRTGSALIRTGKTTAAPDPTVPRSHPGEKPPPPKRCNGQVHPTARSVDSFHARIPAIRSSLQPFVPSPCQNGKPQPHHTPKQPPARFTPQQE